MTEKRFNLWDIEGTAFIEDHKEGSYHIGKTEDVDIISLRDITKRLNIYAEENEQLKSTIKEVTELLSDEVDLFSDEATEHDINAYMELKEFDNKDAYYMATATKKAIQKLKELTR